MEEGEAIDAEAIIEDVTTTILAEIDSIANEEKKLQQKKEKSNLRIAAELHRLKEVEAEIDWTEYEGSFKKM